MERPFLFPHHSFRLILYLEWILLSITLLGAIRPLPFEIPAPNRFLSLLTIIIFGLMGLALPAGKIADRILYTALEFLLLFFTFLVVDDQRVFLPLLGLIVVIRSCLLFEQLGRLIVAGLVFIFFLLTLFQQIPPPPHPRHPHPPISPEAVTNTILTLKLNTAVTFGLTLLFILLLVNALLAERQSREKLMLANTQLRQYALRIEDQATLQERNRIAREIHDSLGHALTAQSIQLENALLFLPQEAEKTAAFLREAKQLGARALQEIRRSISTLRSHPLQGQSLEAAITKAVTEFQQTYGVLPECNIQVSPNISSEISTAIYRIMQESLTNIYKHSQATKISISLYQNIKNIHLLIEDNGMGFNPEVNTTGFGLQGMRERTEALGGQFSLLSQPGTGCQISVLIPLPRLSL